MLAALAHAHRSRGLVADDVDAQILAELLLAEGIVEACRGKGTRRIGCGLREAKRAKTQQGV